MSLCRSRGRSGLVTALGAKTRQTDARDGEQEYGAAALRQRHVLIGLNLAAAVQVAAYELRMAALAPGAGTGECASTSGAGEPARHEDVERLYGHLEASLYGSGFLQPGNPRRLMERMRRLFGRAGLEVEEVNILRGMLTQWDLAGSSPGKAVVGQAAADPAAPQHAPTPILDKNNRK